MTDSILQTRHPIAARVRNSGSSIFAEMSALAREHGAVNLGQGFPDFDVPDAVKAAAFEAIAAGHNQYAISSGEPVLRKAIAEHSVRFYGQEFDADTEITVTSGATEALWCSAFAILEPGDEAIVFEPCYDAYVPAITMAGAKAVPITLHAPDFRFDPEELRASFTEHTKAIYVNTPHNPTGTMFTREELGLIAELCNEFDVIAITDEVYEHITFDETEHIRLSSLPGMRERTLTISSAGKTFSCTGWKIGWAIGPAQFQRALRGVHQWTTFASSAPMQHAIAAALGQSDDYYRTLKTEYQDRRDFLFQGLERCGFSVKKPAGSYFIMAGIEKFGAANAEEFSRRLVAEFGVAVIPPTSFYLKSGEGSNLVRFCFCKKRETLEAAVERLSRLTTI